MLVLETVLRIRREHASGKAIKAIARDLHLSRKVVRKAIRAPDADMAYRREVQPLPKLGPFQGQLDTLLEEDEARPRREKLRLTRIHDLLVREGFDGSYDAVRRYAARWRRARRRDVMDAPAFSLLRGSRSVRRRPAGLPLPQANLGYATAGSLICWPAVTPAHAPQDARDQCRYLPDSHALEIAMCKEGHTPRYT